MNTENLAAAISGTGIIYNDSGDEKKVTYRRRKEQITATYAKHLKSQGWNFDWSKPQKEGYEVYEIFTQDDQQLQGMIAIKLDFQSSFVDVDIVESAPHNIGHNGRYKGVGRCLFAIACYKSLQAGFGGYVGFVSKTNLIEYYKKALKAVNIGGQKMCIAEIAALNLISKFIKEDERVMTDKVKEVGFEYANEEYPDICYFATDGRLTLPHECAPNYDIRAIDREMKRLGRQLTEEELEKYILPY